MNNAKKFYEQGLMAEKAGKFKEALRYYRASARENPGFRPALNNLGVMYSKLHRPDLAVGFFKRALELGEDYIINFNLGTEFFRLEKYKLSEFYLKNSLKLNNRVIKAHILLAYLYEKLHDYKKSEIYFQNSQKLDLKNRTAALGYTVFLMDRGREENALSIVQKYLEVKPEDDQFHKLLAGLLLKLRKTDESQRVYSELAKTSEEYTSFTEHLQDLRKEKNKEYNRMFEGIDDKIQNRIKRLKRKIEKRKKLAANNTGEVKATESPDEMKQDLKDMVDISFLHLFNGDTEKALNFLFKARKMKDKQS